MANALVLQSDFGLDDGAVAAMRGVAYAEDKNLDIFDLTHNIPQYDVWEASYRLIQTIEFWPAGTVFVSVVDPGVGSTRLSLVAKTKTGQYIITPDNGTLTHIKTMLGIEEVRVVEETRNHYPKKGLSYTFHGRDVYAYNGARLASGHITFEELGRKIDIDSIEQLPIKEAHRKNDAVVGTIDVLDVRYGSLWTNINIDLFNELGFEAGKRIEVTIKHNSRIMYQNFIAYGKSFADVRIGESLVYINSLNNMAVAINQGSFSKAYGIGTGNSWEIRFAKTNIQF